MVKSKIPWKSRQCWGTEPGHEISQSMTYHTNLASDLPVKTNFSSPERDFSSARPSWSLMVRAEALMVKCVLVQQEGPHTPLTPSRAPEQPCQCWTFSSCPQRRDSSVPHNTNLCLILLERRWSKVERPWHPMDKSKTQVHTLFLCGSSAHHVLQQLSWKNTWFWPTGGSGRNKGASKQNHFQPSPSSKGLN